MINVYICTLHAFLNQTLNVIKTRGGERGDLVKIFNEISSFLPSLVSGSCTNTRQVPQKFGHIEKKNCLSDGEYHIIGENWTRKVKIMRLASIAKKIGMQKSTLEKMFTIATRHGFITIFIA